MTHTRVLIVDDHPMVAQGIRALLETYDDLDIVGTLTNGQEAVDRVAALDPDVILLDLNMPRKDGREALREIKADPALRGIPVVILTTSKAEEDVVRSYRDGVNSFITKPVTFTALLEVVQTLGKYWLQVVDLPGAEGKAR